MLMMIRSGSSLRCSPSYCILTNVMTLEPRMLSRSSILLTRLCKIRQRRGCFRKSCLMQRSGQITSENKRTRKERSKTYHHCHWTHIMISTCSTAKRSLTRSKMPENTRLDRIEELNSGGRGRGTYWLRKTSMKSLRRISGRNHSQKESTSGRSSRTKLAASVVEELLVRLGTHQ